jgi:formylglycine-generating enzyme required for sulfatase activity
MPSPAGPRPVLAILFTLALAFASPSARAQPAPTLDIPLGSGSQISMVLVPAGSFRQGTPASDKGRGDDEVLHDVTIGSPFYIGRYPVTRGQYRLFVEQSGYVTEAEKGGSGGSGWDGHQLVQRKEFTWRSPGFAQTDNDPVTLVTYDDAQAFAAWLTRKAARRVDLPTEAQWEYAARAGSKTPFFGAEDDEHALDIGWFQKNAGNGTRPVGRRMPNAWNLHEMSGNVYEWCRDWYAPYGADPQTDPEVTTPPAGDTPRRVLRGGSWLKPPRAGRSGARYRNTPGSRNADNGFRIIADVQGPPAPRSTSAPARAPAAAPPQPVTDGGGGEGSSIVGAVVAGLVGVLGVIVGLLVYLRRRGGPALDAGSVQTRLGADGFWVTAPAPAGARVRYEATVGGVPVTDVVTLDGDPQGTFVYTGSPPGQVRILQLTAGAASAIVPFVAGAPVRRAYQADEPDYIAEPPPGRDPPAY